MVIMIIIIALLILLLIVADASSRKVLYPNHRTLKMSEDIVKEEDDEWRDFDKKDTEEVDFILKDNYIIHGTMVYNDRNSKKFVIHTHGFRFTRHGGIKYLDAFFNAGYNVYMYDLRSHGENVRGPIGMGEAESDDLAQIINLFRRKYGTDITLGLHGESLGAFTSLMVLNNKPTVDFVIEDCAYSDTIRELKYQMGRNKIPPVIFKLVVIVARVKYKQHWSDYDARKVVKTSTLPICFIHGNMDTFTPPYMAKDLYEACDFKENKELIYFDGAEHANSEKSNPQKYVDEVKSFIDNLNI
jgi:alpha-beta hydrolase superfamily lysophospholipase